MPSATTRLIDNESGTRTRPMKVLCLGLGRTGTMSLREALHQLSYRPYHLADAVQAGPAKTLPLWCEAMTAKFVGGMKPFGREEFDKLTGEFDGVMDTPTVFFIDELLAAYPDAKVVLTNRDVDKWVDSWRKTVLVVMSWRSWSWLAPWDSSMAGPWHIAATMMVNDLVGDRSLGAKDYLGEPYAKKLRAAFIEHYEHVRKSTPKEKLLEFKSEDGWAPLCEFLGVKIPDTPYPFVNESKDFVMWHVVMWYMALGKMIAKTVLPVVVASGSWFLWQKYLAKDW